MTEDKALEYAKKISVAAMDICRELGYCVDIEVDLVNLKQNLDLLRHELPPSLSNARQHVADLTQTLYELNKEQL